MPIPMGAFVIGLLLAAVTHAQPNYLTDSSTRRRSVVEGREVSILATHARGNVQWQVRAEGSAVWINLSDDDAHRGTATRELEIRQASFARQGSEYRFIDTVDGVATVGPVFTLNVMPPLFSLPVGVLVDSSGELFVSDAAGHTIEHVANARWFGWGNDVLCTTGSFAGVAGLAGDLDGIRQLAQFNQPAGMAIVGINDYVIADSANGTIRRVRQGQVSTVAGSSTERGSIDGAVAAARFSRPMGVARTRGGAFIVVDSANHTIRRLEINGAVSTLAGSPGMAGSVDGIGPAARFSHPTGVAVDIDGMIYVTDTGNNLIRKITPEGVVTTLAGIPGVAGAADGMPGEATFNGPTGILAGNALLVCDTGNSTIRSVSTKDGRVSLFAGVPTVSGLRDGEVRFDPAIGSSTHDILLNQPRGIEVDRDAGLYYIADSGNAVIRVIGIYDGFCATLPVGFRVYTLPEPPPPPAPVAPILPSTPTPAPSPGGGGAPSAWFFLLMAVALFGRLAGLARSR